MPLKVFVDSDVVVSSLLSSSGAAYLLLNTKNLKLFISNFSVEELIIVTSRLNIDRIKLDDLITKRLNLVRLKETLKNLKKKYSHYVTDPSDAHIVAGAHEAKVKFLISYNIKHFKIDKIKQNLGIIVTTPAELLQYLRSL